MRRAILLLSTMALVVLMAGGVALAEIRIGTDNPETLTGTNSNDHITGMGGNDTLKGLAANDTYHFDDGWGNDTLTETAFVKVGKKKKPGGSDTLNFSQVSGSVHVYMVPQWTAALGFYNDVFGLNDTSVDLGTSPVENAVGGSDNDDIRGGSAKNTLSGGPGGSDALTDLGGYAGNGVLPAVPASDDTYEGFTSGTGVDGVADYGGTADKLDLRPLKSYEVYFDALDHDNNGSNDSLRIVINEGTTVTVYGQFSPVLPGQQNGRMEQIIFSNETITSAAELNSLM